MSDRHILLKHAPDGAAAKSKFSLWRLLPVAVILGGLGLGYAFGLQHYLSLSYLGESRAALKAFVESNYLISLAVFVSIYILCVAFSFPAATILTVFGGFLFGWLVSGPVVVVAATIGACILFLATRSALGGFLRERVGGRAAALAQGFKKDAFSYVLVLRLAPVFPFFFVNIAAALFDVSLRTFAAATFIGIIPGTFAYSFLGQGVDSVLDAAQKAGAEASVRDLVTPQITLAFAVLACAAALPVIIKKLRKSSDGTA